MFPFNFLGCPHTHDTHSGCANEADVPGGAISGRAVRTTLCYTADGCIRTRVVAETGTPPFRWERASSGLGWRAVPASRTIRAPAPRPAADAWRRRRRRQLPSRRRGTRYSRLAGRVGLESLRPWPYRYDIHVTSRPASAGRPACTTRDRQVLAATHDARSQRRFAATMLFLPHRPTCRQRQPRNRTEKNNIYGLITSAIKLAIKLTIKLKT